MKKELINLLKKFQGNQQLTAWAMLIKIICLTRLNFPRAGINLSTRESPKLRNHALEIGITKMSGGSNTSVGGYTLKNKQDQNPQFDIEDDRSVAEIIKMLKTRQFDPVLTDWRRIDNDSVVKDLPVDNI